MRLRFVLASAGLLALAACDKGSPGGPAPQSAPSVQEAAVDSSCSSPIALKLVHEIVAEGIESDVREANKGLPENRRLDLGKVRALASELQFELQDIMTAKVDPNSTKKFCEAQLVMRVPSSTLDAADRQRRERGQPRIQTMAEDENFKVDLDKFSTKLAYNVQPTDDGKKLYLGIENAKRIQALATEIVVFASVNSRTSQPAQTSIQEAALGSPAQAVPVAPAVVGGAAPSPTKLPRSEELVASATAYENAEREINLIWKALPRETRDQHLQAQRDFNAEKESVCFREASAAGEGDKFEAARNNCWTRFYRRRIPELRALGAR